MLETLTRAPYSLSALLSPHPDFYLCPLLIHTCSHSFTLVIDDDLRWEYTGGSRRRNRQRAPLTQPLASSAEEHQDGPFLGGDAAGGWAEEDDGEDDIASAVPWGRRHPSTSSSPPRRSGGGGVDGAAGSSPPPPPHPAPANNASGSVDIPLPAEATAEAPNAIISDGEVGWLRYNPVGVPTEREVYMDQVTGGRVYRLYLDRCE